ncbi:MAG: serine/threonine protein kinase [Muribaculaceae bacterium]
MAASSIALPKGHILKSPNYTYRIESVLGCGGFGITYLASANIKVGNVFVKATFAIKEHFLSSDCEREGGTSRVVYSNPAKERVENSLKDFISEAKRLHKVGVEHPNIVKVNEVFEANNTAYYVMEYLGGKSLRTTVTEQGVMSEKQAVEVMKPVIDAVLYLHSYNMTHLDIKPDNIMLERTEDGGIRPVLIDFGLSKHYDKDGKPTSTIKVLGCSDGYAPVEQYAGITQFSPTADYYALGATMWYCLKGKDPKKSTDLEDGELAEKIAPVSDKLSRFIAKACALNRNKRAILPIGAENEPSVGEAGVKEQERVARDKTVKETSVQGTVKVKKEDKRTKAISEESSQVDDSYQLFKFSKTAKIIVYCAVAVISLISTALKFRFDMMPLTIGFLGLMFLSVYALVNTNEFVKSGKLKYILFAAMVPILTIILLDIDEANGCGFGGSIILLSLILLYEMIVHLSPRYIQLFFIAIIILGEWRLLEF